MFEVAASSKVHERRNPHDMDMSVKPKAARAAQVLANMTIAGEGEVEARLLPAITGVERPATLGFINAHGVNLCWDDAEIASNFAGLDFLLRDGIGVDLCCRRMGWPSGANLNGTDFIPRVLDRRNGSVALLGTQSPWLDEAADRLRKRGLDIGAVHHGFEDVPFYVDLVMKQRPATVVLAMGMPKQEQVAALIRERADWPVLVICGGAILDWIAERFTRAPEFYQNNNLEWLYRLMKEPKRLFRRYVIGNPLLLMRIPALARTAKKLDLKPRTLPRA